jgi:hypothetical protein
MSDPKNIPDKSRDEVPASPAGKVEVTDDYLKQFGKWDEFGTSNFLCSCQTGSCTN